MPLYPPLVTSSGQVVVSRSGLPFCNELVPTIAYIPISVTNSATIATSTLFQQYITVDLSGASQYINPDLSNLSIVDSAFATLASWRESGTTNTGNASWWVLIPSGIPASSEIGLAVMINLSGGTVVDGVTTGISPLVAQQLGLAYGTDDNGANVFNNYWNFAGTSLPSGWVNDNNGYGSITVNNGITAADGAGASVDITATSNIIEGYVNPATGSPLGTAKFDAEPVSWGVNSSYQPYIYTTKFNFYSPTEPLGTYNIYGMANNGTTAWWYFNYAQVQTQSTTASEPSQIFLGDGGSAGGAISAYWVRVRTYVSTMPSVTVDPLTIYYATLTNF
jgi:hypothetical protein